MQIQAFFDEATATLSYVVHDDTTAIVIDPVQDYDDAHQTVDWSSARAIAEYIDQRKLSLEFVIDTHMHADHLSGAPYFRERYGAQTATGAGSEELRRMLAERLNFNLENDWYDFCLAPGAMLTAGTLRIEVIASPGHTPAHIAIKIEDAIFVGDTLFMPDYGTARADFPGGSASELYDSIQTLYAYPDETRLFVGHDYRPNGRELRFETTVGEQKRHNIHVRTRTAKAQFVATREKRDATLDAPRLFAPSIRANVHGGALPYDRDRKRAAQ